MKESLYIFHKFKRERPSVMPHPKILLDFFGRKGQRCPRTYQFSIVQQELVVVAPIDESQDSKLLQPGAIMGMVPGCILGTYRIIAYCMI